MRGLDTIHHVAVSVTEIAEAVHWYQCRFRCEVVHQDDTWAMLKFANSRLALVVPEEHPPHIGFISNLSSEGGCPEAHANGTCSTYLKDPSGNTVEILGPNLFNDDPRSKGRRRRRKAA